MAVDNHTHDPTMNHPTDPSFEHRPSVDWDPDDEADYACPVCSYTDADELLVRYHTAVSGVSNPENAHHGRNPFSPADYVTALDRLGDRLGEKYGHYGLLGQLKAGNCEPRTVPDDLAPTVRDKAAVVALFAQPHAPLAAVAADANDSLDDTEGFVSVPLVRYLKRHIEWNEPVDDAEIETFAELTELTGIDTLGNEMIETGEGKRLGADWADNLADYGLRAYTEAPWLERHILGGLFYEFGLRQQEMADLFGGDVCQTDISDAMQAHGIGPGKAGSNLDRETWRTIREMRDPLRRPLDAINADLSRYDLETDTARPWKDDPDLLDALYYDHDLSQREMGRLLGCDASDISAGMRDAGIAPGGHGGGRQRRRSPGDHEFADAAGAGAEKRGGEWARRARADGARDDFDYAQLATDLIVHTDHGTNAEFGPNDAELVEAVMHGATTIQAVADAVERSYSAVASRLKRLHSVGILARSDGRGNSPHDYWVPGVDGLTGAVDFDALPVELPEATPDADAVDALEANAQKALAAVAAGAGASTNQAVGDPRGCTHEWARVLLGGLHSDGFVERERADKRSAYEYALAPGVSVDHLDIEIDLADAGGTGSAGDDAQAASDDPDLADDAVAVARREVEASELPARESIVEVLTLLIEAARAEEPGPYGSQLADDLGYTQATTSRGLVLLREAGLATAYDDERADGQPIKRHYPTVGATLPAEPPLGDDEPVVRTCGCGEAFTTTPDYAAHKRWCDGEAEPEPDSGEAADAKVPCDDHDTWVARCDYCRGLAGGTRATDDAQEDTEPAEPDETEAATVAEIVATLAREREAAEYDLELYGGTGDRAEFHARGMLRVIEKVEAALGAESGERDESGDATTDD